MMRTVSTYATGLPFTLGDAITGIALIYGIPLLPKLIAVLGAQ